MGDPNHSALSSLIQKQVVVKGQGQPLVKGNSVLARKHFIMATKLRRTPEMLKSQSNKHDFNVDTGALVEYNVCINVNGFYYCIGHVIRLLMLK
jgi:hypothetical protein